MVVNNLTQKLYNFCLEIVISGALEIFSMVFQQGIAHP
jgi:hypothetical protein